MWPTLSTLCILHPTPPSSYALCPTPPSSYALCPTPYTLHPHPTSCAMPYALHSPPAPHPTGKLEQGVGRGHPTPNALHPTSYTHIINQPQTLQVNSRRLWEQDGWRAILLDGGFENASLHPNASLHRHFITRENIVDILQLYVLTSVYTYIRIFTKTRLFILAPRSTATLPHSKSLSTLFLSKS